MYNKFLGKILSQIYKKSGYIPVITMMLAAPMITQAADNFSTVTSVFQQITVTGTVTDSQGETLPGVTIMVKGTTAGVVTNIEGRFSVTVPDEDAVLVFSFIGFETQEILVGNNRVIDVSLGDEATRMDELVVTGYMSLRRESLTGSIATIGSQELTATTNENVVNALAGRMPGVRIQQRNARPGDYNTVIDIRGFGDPLFVVDGVPRDRNYFARMDADEIENVSVLKDGAAAIYGMRAANGVILVTTKSGVSQQGKVDITYTGSYTWQQFLNTPESYTVYQWFDMRNEHAFAQFNEQNFFKRSNPRHGPGEYAEWFDEATGRELQGANWIDATFKKVVPQTQHNLQVNGGNDYIRYFFSMGYMKQDGMYKSGSLWGDRFNFRSNIDAKITDRLRTRVSFSGILNTNHDARDADWSTYKYAWLHVPISSIYSGGNPDYLNGDRSVIMDEVNSLAQTDHRISGYNLSKQRRLEGGLTFMYDIPGIKGLTAEAFYNYSLSMPDTHNLRRRYELFTYSKDQETGVETFSPIVKNNPQTVRRSITMTNNTNMQFRLRYNTSYDLHRVNSVLVFEEQGYNYDGFSAYRELIINSEYLASGENNANQRAEGNTPVERASRSFIGQFSYGYSDRYLFDFNFRYEGSSKWPAGRKTRWGFFPSLGVGWVISSESFMQNLNFDALSLLKIRASYGEAGDDSAGGDYPPVFTFYETRAQNPWYFTGSSNDITAGVRPSSLPNPTLTWYKAIFRNISLDFGFFNQKLTGTFEVFQRDRTGLLGTASSQIPGTVGASLPQQNLNSDRRFGYEIDLAHRNNIGGVRYQIAGQFSSTRTMRLDWLETPANHSYDHWRNRSSGRYQNIQWQREAGVRFQNMDEIRSFSLYPLSQGTLPGDYAWIDYNGDGISNNDDRFPYGTTGLPLFNYGFSARANYQGFDLSLNFQGTYKVYVSYGEVLNEHLPFGGNQNGFQIFLDRWHPVNPDQDWWHHDTQWNSGHYMIAGRHFEESLNYRDCSYLRLKTLEVGYSLPNDLLDRVRIKSLRVYVNAYNLLTFTKLTKGFDPERPGGGAVDFYQYPNNRTFSIGTSIKF